MQNLKERNDNLFIYLVKKVAEVKNDDYSLPRAWNQVLFLHYFSVFRFDLFSLNSWPKYHTVRNTLYFVI